MEQQTAGGMPAAGYAAEALPEHIVQAMQEGRHMAACFVPYLVTLDQGAAVQAQAVALLAHERERAGDSNLFHSRRGYAAGAGHF